MTEVGSHVLHAHLRKLGEHHDRAMRRAETIVHEHRRRPAEPPAGSSAPTSDGQAPHV